MNIRRLLDFAILIFLISTALLGGAVHKNTSNPLYINNQQVASSSLASPSFAAYATDAVGLVLQSASGANAAEGNNMVSFKGKNISIEYNLSAGTADFYRGGRKVITGFFSEVMLQKLLSSKDYPSRSVISDGNEYTVVSSGGGNPTMKQRFNLKGDDYFTITVEMDGTSLSSNWMAPVVMIGRGGMDPGSGNDVRALWVPFDNDKDAKYDASTINTEDTSYEVAAFYDNSSRNGLVVGSVTHDTWKTGVSYKGSNNKVDLLEICGGITINSPKHGSMNRDVMPHGSVKGDNISSPEIFVGFFDDWRNGMETYADANAAVVPKLAWNGGVPFGWNSWGAVGSSLNTQNALAASNFIKSLMGRGFENNNTAYINLDSYWDSSAIDLDKFVRTVHANGQKAGIYWAPFVDWGKDPNRRVEGSNCTYKDIWLKDDKGNPIDYGDGCYALDPTHPGTQQRINYYINLFMSKGFDSYIKIDFLSHGALEGKHFDNSVTTGMQAFNTGMEYLDKAVRSIMGPDTFISEAISPLFPYQYANSRRISCDKYGYLYESRDLMNTVAYGWWMNGRLYSYNDPDHMVLYSIWWKSSVKITENEAKTRVTSAAVAGTVFLSGDDFTDQAAQARAAKYLTNTNINRIAASGKPFRPVEGNTGTGAPDIFVMDDGANGLYIAVFNWDSGKPSDKTIDLKRAGLDPNKKYNAVEQWSNMASQVSGKMKVSLGPAEARIYLFK